jgi:hypothetical protein
VATRYGADAVGHVDVRRFSVFYSMRIARAAGGAPCAVKACSDSLLCSGLRLFNGLHISAKVHARSIYVRPDARLAPKHTFARSGELVEVEHEWPHPFPEGVLFGCWTYLAAGSGIFVDVGRTEFFPDRMLAQRKFNLVADGVSPDGTPGPMVAANKHFRGGNLIHVCVWVSPAGPESGAPLVALGTLETRPAPSLFSIGRARELCLGLPGVASSVQLLEAGPLGGSARGAESSRGALVVLPALDGMLAWNVAAAGLDSLQFTTVHKHGVIELVLATPTCRNREAPLSSCLPAGLPAFSGAPDLLRLGRNRSAIEMPVCNCTQPRKSVHSAGPDGRDVEMMMCDH